MIADVIQKDRIKEQKLQFIRNHQQAFDVEPIYPLPLPLMLSQFIRFPCLKTL